MLLVIQESNLVKRVNEALADEGPREAEVTRSSTSKEQQKARDVLNNTVGGDNTCRLRDVHTSDHAIYV